MKNKFDTFKESVEKFQALQHKYAKWGADDSEPDGIFQRMLLNTFRGNPKVPLNWEIYSSMKGYEEIVKKLTVQAAKCVVNLQAIPIKYIKELSQWIDDFCWRCAY